MNIYPSGVIADGQTVHIRYIVYGSKKMPPIVLKHVVLKCSDGCLNFLLLRWMTQDDLKYDIGIIFAIGIYPKSFILF